MALLNIAYKTYKTYKNTKNVPTVQRTKRTALYIYKAVRCTFCTPSFMCCVQN